MGGWGNLVGGLFAVGVSYAVQPLKNIVFTIFPAESTPLPLNEMAAQLQAGLFYLGAGIMAIATLQLLYHYLLGGHGGKKREPVRPEPQEEQRQPQQRPGPQQPEQYDTRNPETVGEQPYEGQDQR